MTRAAFILAALLLIAAPAAAVPIIPPMPSADCVLEEITPERPFVEDKGWDWLQQLLGLSDAEIDARREADRLHEPEPEASVYAWRCPGGCPHVPMGGGGSTSGGGQPGGGSSVPEPASLAMAGVGIVGLWLRRRG